MNSEREQLVDVSKDLPVPAAPAVLDRRPPERRLLSMVERTWIAADMMNPPFVNQLVLEGEGGPQDLERWTRAVERVALAQPGCRMRLHGHLKWSWWVADGPTPPVRQVDGSGWNGRNPEGAPFLKDRLPYRAGPTAEVLLVSGDPLRVVIRTHHATMDGGGTLTFVEDLFRALRGEEPRPAQAGPLTDEALARLVPGVKPMPLSPADCLSPLGAPVPAPFGTTWRRVHVSGRLPRVLPLVAVCLVRAAGEQASGRLPIGVPVDMRQFHPEIRSNANLTGMVRLDLDQHLTQADPIASIAAELKRLVQAREDARNLVGMGFMKWTALFGMKVVGTLMSKANLRNARFDTVAVLSNLGRMPLELYSAPCFTTRRAFFIPPSNPGLPLFMALSGGPQGLEICATSGLGFASEARLDRFMERLVEELQDAVQPA